LTAFPEIREKAAQRFAEDLWMVIQYDISSDHWAEQLRRKVEYILLVERSQPIPGYEAFLGIVAALPTPELAAVLDGVPWEWSSIQLPSDASQYYEGKIRKDSDSRRVVAVAAPRMGMTAAAVTSMKMISAFRPRYLAMVGIAAGVKGRCQLGDIVVADPSWDWGSGKISGVGAASRFQQAPDQIPMDSFLRAKVMLLARNEPVLDAIRRGWKGSTIDHVLRMYVGPAASGAAVLADKRTVEGIIDQHRKLLAIEMETYGVYAAAQGAPLPQPKVFSVKSICDYADDSKSDSHQAYASYTSAQALKVLAEEYI
jgi:nucleoside phosphorylase